MLFSGTNSPFSLNKIVWYKPLLLLRACTLPPAWGRGYKFEKSLCWGARKFYFGVRDYIVMGGGGGGHVTLKKKLKLHKTSIKSILGMINLIYFRDNASAKFWILPVPFSWNSRVWSFSHPSWGLKQFFLEDFCIVLMKNKPSLIQKQKSMVVKTCFFNVLFELYQKSIMTASNQL